MTKTTAFALATTLGLFVSFSGVGAQAQSGAPAPKPITIRLGVFLPSSGTLKDVIGKTWFSAGADYAFVKSAEGGTAAGLVPLGYVDYAINNSHGVTADYIGLGPGVRLYGTAPGTAPLTPYVGAGAGAYFLHASGNGSHFDKTRFGFKVNAGVEFKQTYVFEVNYTNAGSVNGTRFDGFNLQVGAKF